MPKIGFWWKSDYHTWKYDNMDITAHFEGERGVWKGVIVDNEFDGRFSTTIIRGRFTTTQNELYDEMRAIHKELKGRR